MRRMGIVATWMMGFLGVGVIWTTSFGQSEDQFTGPAIDWTAYGYLLPDLSTEEVALWWCEAGWKIGRHRPLPTQTGQVVRLLAAGNDWEAVQVVLVPRREVKLLEARPTAFRSPDGATISSDNVRVLWVYYHWVENPTDKTGKKDWWPDALPPLKEPLTLPAGVNSPLWVLVYVPAGTPAGRYRGSVALKFEKGTIEIPIELEVWGFSLPEKNRLETAFGFDPWLAFQYHNARNDSDRRQLLDLYLQSFAEHRISPYNPAPLDPIRVKFLPDANPPRAEIDFSDWEREMSRVLQRFRFTNFMLTVHGMGGGSFHERYEPEILGFGESTPQYQAMFASYVQQLESFLRQKGWLRMAYIYWFDEPEPKDYDFVTKGMERLKKYAPGLQRMLTEEPNEKLIAPVDIWCPITPNYNHEIAEERRKRGERFWWYICTGPKAPYCTLFIDHPGTELRVWLWQTWQRKIAGILVWQTNYWTSSAAYPDSFQDPYQDPMSYVSGYSTPRGVKRHWGNGDGRFIYPPLSASVPGKAGGQPVLEGPVSSIRWEMLREGVEDYEMLAFLRELLEQARPTLAGEKAKHYESLLEVPGEITRSMTAFTVDPRVILARRASVAAAIEELMRQK
ncbi:MAG: DUF4091 domain-containing protein [Thermoguttaceae bacterium]|nr:DUF4091 domain-containing protein [Thermoguttaceae bacterium]MDW8079096.1 DUF4091 domain-containing protein [Thermoguttaceae bacterium]